MSQSCELFGRFLVGEAVHSHVNRSGRGLKLSEFTLLQVRPRRAQVRVRPRTKRESSQHQTKENVSCPTHRPRLSALLSQENEPKVSGYSCSSRSSAAFAAARIIAGPLFRVRSFGD